MLDPFADAEGLDALAKSGIALFAMELMPRISARAEHGRAVLAVEPRRL